MPFYHPLLEEFHTPVNFFTSTILNWKHLLSADHRKEIIIGSFKHLIEQGRINLYGFVVMPNHIHMLLTMCEGELFSAFQRDFGKFTANKLKYDLEIHDPDQLKTFKSTQQDRKYQIWERRPLSIPVYNEKIFIQKLNYIHNNPCKPPWNLASNPEDYFYSSAKFYKTGFDDWGFMKHFWD